LTIHCDSQNDIHLVDYQVYCERTKHKDVRLHFVRNVVESWEVRIENIASEKYHVDVFRNSLPRWRFK